MPNAIMFISFSLVEGASVPDFLISSEKVHSEFMSKQKGYISWQQLVDGDVWADLVTWETMDDAKSAMETSCTNAFVIEFSSFIDPKSVKAHLFTVKKSY